jgi:hypothetical protein
MPTRSRKVEVYCLTISGLEDGTNYGIFLRDIWEKAGSPAATVMRRGEKWHCLHNVIYANRRLKLRFLSFKRGHRPDVIDTDKFSLQPNPLMPSQTGVEWTHAIGGKIGGRFLLAIERNFNGIWASTMEFYFQSLIDKFFEDDEAKEDEDPITVSLEADPGPEFLERIKSLDRIKAATVRFVRPNPGWKDLDTELGEVAKDSDAHRAEVTMRARRKDTLDNKRGILGWILHKFKTNTLDYAAIEGHRGKQSDSFNTKKLGRHSFVSMEIDEAGQIIPDDAWHKMADVLKKSDN